MERSKPQTQKQPIILQALIGKLEDCITMIDCVPDAEYVLTVPYKSNPHKTHSSIGQHTRHIVEFVETLLKQYQTRYIDYDRRERNQMIETNREVAKGAVQKAIDLLDVLEESDLVMPVSAHEAVHVKSDIEPQSSTLGREILFAISHTEHHFALISIQCDNLGIQLPNHFGKAISTLRYELSLQN